MNFYNYTHTLEVLWRKAVRIYSDGQRDPQTYFTEDEKEFLGSIGASAQEIFDFAEDYCNNEEPDFATFAQIQGLRFDFFQNVQRGIASTRTIEPENLPPKDAAYEGIEWLPRITAKAKAKLRGEMSDQYMYGCGGDRSFCRKHNINLAELLMVVSRNMESDQAVANFIRRRSPGLKE